MTRKELREHIFKLLFISEFHDPEELDEQIDGYFAYCSRERVERVEDGDLSAIASVLDEEDIVAVTDKFSAIRANQGEIDYILNEATSGWKLTRMGKVELSILRLATYEIRYDDTVPDKVAINEAVELAKQYGQDAAYSFVNGILAKLVQ